MGSKNSTAFSRRGFLGIAAGTGLVGTGVLAGCNRAQSAGSGGKKERLKFWNMPWGNEQFNVLDKKITTGFTPPEGLAPATYQVIQWADWSQAFPAALASNTGPAVSSGGGTMAFQFEGEGKIAYADNLLKSWEKNGLRDDFLPGLLETMKVEKGYAAIPYNLDMRVLWYNKKLLDKADVEPPTDWDSYLKVCAALKKIGVYGWGTSAGQGAGVGYQTLFSYMINNGGGVFNEGHEPDLLYEPNVEALDFALECIKKGYSDPRVPSYTSANSQSQWKAHKYGMGVDTAGLANNLGGEVAKEIVVGSPLTSPSGKKGALYFPNNIMMYTNTPSQQDSEAFLTYYYQNMAPLWTKHTGIGLPPLKSIAQTAAFRDDKNAVKAINEWQPISKTLASRSDTMFPGVTTIDGTDYIDDFAQSFYSGKVTVKAALTKLQDDIAKALKAHG